MGFNAHRGTQGHKVGMSIIGKEAGKDNSSDPESQSGGFNFKSLRAETSHNGGVIIHHTPVQNSSSQLSEGGIHPEDPSQEQSHIFRNAQEAHEHLGMLLGLREGSGQQRD